MDESLRARLESLNRAPLGPSSTRRGTSCATEPHRHSSSRLAGSSRAIAQSLTAPARTRDAACPIGGLLHGGQVVETTWGSFLQIELPVERLWKGGDRLMTARQAFLRSQLSGDSSGTASPVADPELAAFIAALPHGVIALDLETCGLAGSALFLVGLLHHRNGVPIVQLLLARNYCEEAAVLAALWEILSSYDVLITFNGKTFDWPAVWDRSVRHRLPLPAARDRWRHIDILHHARRRWRGTLPDCRLQTLERHVCRRERKNDVPGKVIPSIYADYVRTGFSPEMDRVLYHNALDLVTLVDLAHRLAA